MDLKLKNKVILISGSSSGIGFFVAEAFLREGAKIQISGRNDRKLQAAFSSLKSDFGSENVDYFCGDLNKSDVVERALAQLKKKFGQIDSVISNVGSGSGPRGWEVSPEKWASMIDKNLLGSVGLATKSVPHLKGRNDPSITFISSIAGLESIDAPIPYSAAKAGLQMASKNLARQLGPDGIRVNTIAPGNVLTPGGVWDEKIKASSDEIKNYIQTEVPLGRLAKPEEIADAVLFLTSERASFISGALLCIDGAQTH